jgi:hypothetical protein
MLPCKCRSPPRLSVVPVILTASTHVATPLRPGVCLLEGGSKLTHWSFVNDHGCCAHRARDVRPPQPRKHCAQRQRLLSQARCGIMANLLASEAACSRSQPCFEGCSLGTLASARVQETTVTFARVQETTTLTVSNLTLAHMACATLVYRRWQSEACHTRMHHDSIPVKHLPPACPPAHSQSDNGNCAQNGRILSKTSQQQVECGAKLPNRGQHRRSESTQN